MFLSLRQPSIVDAGIQAAISKARSENGVHIYFNEPHMKEMTSFSTPLADMAATTSTYLTWTSMLRTKEDHAYFFLALCGDGTTTDLAYGVTVHNGQHCYYTARRESFVWGGQQFYSPTSLKKGQYVVLALHIQYPHGTIVAPVKFEVNGVEQATQVTFTTKPNFSKLGSALYEVNLNRVELLETHLLYTGITQGLPPRAYPTAYISLETAKLARLTQWDTVDIKGQYAALNQSYKGILVGVNAAGKSAAFCDIGSYQGDNATVTIRLTVGFNNVAVSTDKEHRGLNIEIGPDDNAWLLVDNINISNLEIYTTAKIEK